MTSQEISASSDTSGAEVEEFEGSNVEERHGSLSC